MRRFRLACTGFPSSADYRSFLVRGKKYFLGSAKYGDPDTGERITTPQTETQLRVVSG